MRALICRQCAFDQHGELVAQCKHSALTRKSEEAPSGEETG